MHVRRLHSTKGTTVDIFDVNFSMVKPTMRFICCQPFGSYRGSLAGNFIARESGRIRRLYHCVARNTQASRVAQYKYINVLR